MDYTFFSVQTHGSGFVLPPSSLCGWHLKNMSIDVNGFRPEHPGDPTDVTPYGGVSKSSLKTVVVWAFSRKELLSNNKVKINFLMIMVLDYSMYALG